MPRYYMLGTLFCCCCTTLSNSSNSLPSTGKNNSSIFETLFLCFYRPVLQCTEPAWTSFVTPCQQFLPCLSPKQGATLEEISRFASGLCLAHNFFFCLVWALLLLWLFCSCCYCCCFVVLFFPAVPNEFEASTKGHGDTEAYSRMLEGEWNYYWSLYTCR